LNLRFYKGFLFDLDGTLIDTAELITESFRHTSREMLGKVLPDEVLLANVGQPLMTQMEVLGGDRAREWYEVYRKFNHARHDEYIRPYPGIEELLKELRRRGAGLAIVTSKSRETVDMAFRCIPIEGFFKSVITTDDTDFHKPSPHPLQLALRQLDLTPDESVYIGDSPFDLEAGQAAGTATAAVGWGIFPPVRLKEMEPDFYFESPDEILDLCPKVIPM
jgi:pyrophosphatase PpaX